MRYKPGHRLSCTYSKWTCGICGASVQTIEYVATGDWRCPACVGITRLDWITRNANSPTATMLLEEYMIPIGGFTVMIDTGCYRCKTPYKVSELDDHGFPFHPRHCNNCTKQCSKCNSWLIITRFAPDRDSDGYKDWVISSLGLLSGRDNYINECMACRPYTDDSPQLALEAPKPVTTPKAEKTDAMARLEAVLAAHKTQ